LQCNDWLEVLLPLPRAKRSQLLHQMISQWNHSNALELDNLTTSAFGATTSREPEPLTGLASSMSRSLELLVAWRSPPIENWNGEIKGYYLRYKKTREPNFPYVYTFVPTQESLSSSLKPRPTVATTK